MKWYLDFGHGGKDSGAVSANKIKESDTVLKIGMLIKNNLEKNNEKVITMLSNTTTPDGYQVGADGAWIQAN